MDRDNRANREPKDLLNFAITAQSSAEPATSNNAAAEGAALMDPERRKWLEHVMGSVFGQNIDPVKQMKSCLDVLASVEADEEQKTAALDALSALTEESMDISNDFHKIGGFPALQALLLGSNQGYRQKSAEIFASLLQNNPYCQEKAIEEGYLPLLLEQMDQEEHSPTLNKILAAISGLLRSNPEAQAAFDKLDGLSVLLRRMIDSPEPRFQTSAAFMLSRICTQNKIFSNYLANMGFVHHFVALLHQEPIPDQLREHLTEVLSVVLRNSEEARKDAAQGSLQLRPMLEARKTAVAGREESADEAEYIDGILELLGSEERQRSSGER